MSFNAEQVNAMLSDYYINNKSIDDIRGIHGVGRKTFKDIKNTHGHEFVRRFGNNRPNEQNFHQPMTEYWDNLEKKTS